MKVFEAIHKQNQALFTDQAVIDWVVKQGMDKTKFEQVYNSFGIDAKVQRAAAMGRAYGVQFTPSIAVNGKYWTGPSMVTNPNGGLDIPRFFEVVEMLVSMERGKPAATSATGQEEDLSVMDRGRRRFVLRGLCRACGAVGARQRCGGPAGGPGLPRHSRQPSADPKRIEVIEFFYYGCHWCNEVPAVPQRMARAQTGRRCVSLPAGHPQHALAGADQGVLHAEGAG